MEKIRKLYGYITVKTIHSSLREKHEKRFPKTYFSKYFRSAIEGKQLLFQLHNDFQNKKSLTLVIAYENNWLMFRPRYIFTSKKPHSGKPCLTSHGRQNVLHATILPVTWKNKSSSFLTTFHETNNSLTHFLQSFFQKLFDAIEKTCYKYSSI